MLNKKFENNNSGIVIDISKLTSGIYFVRAKSTKQNFYSSEKIIISRD